jgi:hypothetical protein
LTQPLASGSFWVTEQEGSIMPVMRSDGASKAQRGYIIGLTRKLNSLLPIDSNVALRIERQAMVGEVTATEALVTIAALEAIINREEKS